MSALNLLKMLSLKWGIGLGITVLLGFGAYAANQSNQPNTLTQETSPQNNAETSKNNPNSISALGRIAPEGEILRVGGPGGDRIAELKVREGQRVQKGDPIAILQSFYELEAELGVAKNRVAESLTLLETEAELAQMQAEEAATRLQQSNLPKEQSILSQEAAIKRLQAELNQATAEVNRYTFLEQKGAATKQVLENRRLTLTQKMEELTQAQALLRQLRQEQSTATENTQAQIESIRANANRSQAQVQLDSALSQVELADIRKEQAIIRAPMTGQVLKVHLRNGESIEPPMGDSSSGQTIVELGRTQQMFVVAEIYETDVSQIKRGMRASIESPVFEGKIDGVVDTIGLKVGKNDVLGTDPAAATDARVVEVKIKLRDSQKVASLTNLQVDVLIHPDKT